MHNSRKEYQTIVLLIGVISKWFTLMTLRIQNLALRKVPGDELSEKKFQESVACLECIIQLFQEMIIGNGAQFKSMQCRIIISTKSIIELSIYLITERNYRYVLTGRSTSDYVENLLSSVRAKQLSPNTLQFKQNLKIIAISKYLKPVDNSSYEDDNRIIAGDVVSKSKAKEMRNKLLPVPDLLTQNVNLGDRRTECII